MAQTAYTETMDAAIEGVIAESRFEAEVKSAIANETIPPGRLVCLLGTGEDPPLVDLPDATGDVTGGLAFGFSLLDPMQESTTGSDFEYAQYEQVPVLREGTFWARSEDAVTTAGSPVFVRFTAGVGEELGALRTDADGGDAVALPGAQFMGVCSAGGLVKVEYKPQQ